MIKILYKVSVFSHFDFNFQSLDTLLDFAVSVHVFNTKKRFSNFNKIIMCQNLLYNSNIIFIEGWSQISLFFKVKNCIKLLTLNHVVYISNFPLNFVFFDCLQKRDFNQFYCLDKISKNSQIIRYTQFCGNNYKLAILKAI